MAQDEPKPKRLPSEWAGFTEAECRSCNAIMPVAAALENECPACGCCHHGWCEPFNYGMDGDFILVLGGIPTMVIGFVSSFAMLLGEIEFNWLGPLSGVLGPAAFVLGLEIADRRWSEGRARGREAYGEVNDAR